MRRQSIGLCRFAAAGLLACLAATIAATAADNSWTNSASGFWQDAANWSAGAAPSTNFSAVWITNSSTKSVTIDSATAAIPGVMTVTNLTISAPAGSANTLLVTNASDGGSALRILKTLTVGTNAALRVTHSSIVVGGLSFYVDGSATLETGALLNATGVIATAYVGYNGPASLALMGGVVVDTDCYVGALNARASNCTALVSGTGSVWSNRNYFYLGYWSANNTLTINQGGAVRSDGFWGGVMPSASNNTVTVTGAGSVWSNKNDFVLGFGGTGNQLTLADSGAIYCGRGFLGNLDYSRSNTALVTGTGSVWGCRSNLTVGYGYGNTLTISSGGRVDDAYSYIGDSGGSNGVTVTGPGSLWNTLSNLYLGRTGPGNTLSIGDGGAVYDCDGCMGYETNSCRNTVLISGAGSVWSNRGDLYIGRSGVSNLLSLNGSGAVFNGTGYVGYNTNADHNTVIVDGPGCVWSNRGYFLYVGYEGAGNVLTITNGGRVYDPAAYLGCWRGSSNNAAVVTGPGSVWSNSSTFLYVGWSGSGNTLTISNGGAVFDQTGIIGGVPLTCNNAATVTGPGSVWSNRAPLHVGQHGTANTLTLTNGGAVYNTWGYLGYEADANSNTVTVTGPGSVWQSSTNLYLAFYGRSNSLTVADVGTVCNTDGVIGYDYCASNNAATVIGKGSVWSNSGWLAIGLLGPCNTLSIRDGGRVYDIEGDIGCDPNACSNSVVVSGIGAVWNNSESLYVGGAGWGNTLAISNSGTVIAPTVVVGGDSTNSAGRLTVAGGSLIATNLAQGGVLQVEHGTVILRDGLVLVDCLVVTNADAHFVRLGGALVITTCTNLPAALDADGDGLPNGWEQAHRLDPLDPTGLNGADGDPDGDGFANLQEYLAGTDPNGGPTLRILGLAASNSDIVVTWQTAGGKTNAVQASKMVGATYTDISPNLIIPGTGDTTTIWLDPGATTNWPARFYRIRLVP